MEDSFSIDFIEAKPQLGQCNKVSFEFGLTPDQTMVSIFLKTRSKYDLARVYGDNTFLFEDNQQINEGLVQYYLHSNNYTSYMNLIGGSREVPEDCVMYIPLSIPVHCDHSYSKPKPKNLLMKDVILEYLEIWSKKHLKFRCDFFFATEPNITDMSLWVKKINTANLFT